MIENSDLLNNADGLYFINADGEADGAQINIIVNDVVVLNSQKSIEVGTVIYRNSDAEFIKLVEQEKSAIRMIGVRLVFSETTDGFKLQATDEDGHQSEMIIVSEKTQANSNESVITNKKISPKLEIRYLLLMESM